MPRTRQRIREVRESFLRLDESNRSMAALPDPARSPAAPTPAAVTVYTLPFCGACARARALLARRAVAYDEVSGAGVADFRGQLAARTGGATVPQIVIRGVALGGADDLARLDRLGLLLPLVAGDPFPVVADRVRRTRRSLGQWIAATLAGRDDRAAPEMVRASLGADGQIQERLVGASEAANPRAVSCDDFETSRDAASRS